MATEESHPCASCKNAASKRCTRCVSGVHANGKPSSPRYCNKSCQIAHWPEHKNDCTPSTHRKLLYDTGTLLQKLFYKVREACFDLPIGRVEELNGQLRIYERPKTATESFLVPFASQAFQTEKDKQAMLSVASCSDAQMKTYKMVQDALSGTTRRIREVTFQPTRTHRAVFIQLDGKTPLVGQNQHEIFKVTLKAGEEYALDLAGAQFGIYRPITPWSLYTHKMGFSDVTETALGMAMQAMVTEAKYILTQTIRENGSFCLSGSSMGALVQHWLQAFFNSEVALWSAKNKSLQQLLQLEASVSNEECTAFISSISEEYTKFGNWLSNGPGWNELMARNWKMIKLGRDSKIHSPDTLQILKKLRASGGCVDGAEVGNIPQDYISMTHRAALEQIRVGTMNAYDLGGL